MKIIVKNLNGNCSNCLGCRPTKDCSEEYFSPTVFRIADMRWQFKSVIMALKFSATVPPLTAYPPGEAAPNTHPSVHPGYGGRSCSQLHRKWIRFPHTRVGHGTLGQLTKRTTGGSVTLLRCPRARCLSINPRSFHPGKNTLKHPLC